MKISILIATKDEPIVNQLIQEVHKELKDYDYEIIVIDKSEVPPVIEKAKLIIQKSDGLGNAFMEGLEEAEGDVIVTMDADFSHDPKDLHNLLNKINDYDIVVGSKYVKGGSCEDPFFRIMISHVANFLARKLLGIKINDPVSGFSAVKREVYDSIKLNPIGYKIITELIFKAIQKGFKITEAPVTFHRRKAGKTKLGFREIKRFIQLLWRLKVKKY